MPLTATAFNYIVLPTDAAPSRGPTPGKFKLSDGVRTVRIRAELTNASSGAAYPTSGGIPLSSTPADWGMIRNLDYVMMYGQEHTASGTLVDQPVWRYAPSSHALVGLRAQYTTAGPGGATELLELSTAWTPTGVANAPVFYFEAKGW